MKTENPEKWSNRRLAAALVFPRISAERYSGEPDYKALILSYIEAGVGGFCIFRGNVDNTYSMIEDLQSQSEIPLLFCADFEYGLTMRLENGTTFPRVMALGRVNNTDLTYDTARAIATEARAIGIKWNLAPVCDINSNRDNPIINVRSFGENKDIVIAHSLAYIAGTQSCYVIACAKHFPGHGDTSVDSHLDLPVLTHTEERIREIELEPFIQAIKSGVRSVMPGHLSVPALDASCTPASLSDSIIRGILKDELQFKGITVSDALEMKAITRKYTSGEAAIKAINAGVDILLLPENPAEAIQALAIEADQNPDFRRKICVSNELLLEEKKWTERNPVNYMDFNKIKTNSVHYEKLALEAAYKAVEIRGKIDNIPINEKQVISAFAFLPNEDLALPSTFFRFLAQAAGNDCDFGFVDENISDRQIDSFLSATADSDIVILAFFQRAIAYKGSSGISDRMNQIARKLGRNKKTIAVFFGNPYLADIILANTYILTYSDTLPSIAAAIMKLSGRNLPD